MHLLLLWPSRLLQYNGFPSWKNLWTNSTLREDDQLLWYKSTYERVHSLKYDLIRLFVVYQGDLKSWKILVLEFRFLFVDMIFWKLFCICSALGLNFYLNKVNKNAEKINALSLFLNEKVLWNYLFGYFIVHCIIPVR